MFRRSKPATATRTYAIRFDRVLEELWQPGDPISLAEYRRPTAPNGFEYECTNAGQTHSEEPNWPQTIAETVDDGSVEWTCRDFDANGSDTIASIAISADTGITVDASGFDNYGVTMTLSGGSIGSSYDITVDSTTAAGEIESATLRLTITE